jgi:hypothetical protein
MCRVKRMVAYCLCLVILIPLSAPVSSGDAKCAYCVRTLCNGFYAYGCSAGGAWKCAKGNLDGGCYRSCTNDTLCRIGGSEVSSLPACSSGPMTAESARQIIKLIAQRKPRKDSESDDAIRADLIKQGGIAVIPEVQIEAPVLFISTRHDADDVLGASTVLNQSKKRVIAIRFGWSVKAPNEPDESAIGKWNVLPNGLRASDSTSIPAQRIGMQSLNKAGTIVRLYVAEVKFEDGSVWKRKVNDSESKRNKS